MVTGRGKAANAARWVGIAVAATCAIGLHPVAAETTASKAKAGKPDAQAVKVTPEMIGAGIVSSGVDLPPIPPLSGSREKPVASWGKPLPYAIVIDDRRNNRLI